MNLLLFDVDGTLTPSGQKITLPMKIALIDVRSRGYILGIVGGGTLEKILWQIDNAIDCFDYVFAESGAIVCQRIGGELRKISEKSMVDHCDRRVLNELIRCGLREISEMPIQFGGNHIDFRHGLVYISPPGMQASETDRSIFIEQNKIYHLREHMLSALKSIDVENKFEISYGGSVGIAISPRGWNKSQVLEHFGLDMTIHYYGDRTQLDGNDYPIYSHPRVTGHAVNEWSDTLESLLRNFVKD
jgi:phosphomannomutase